MRDIRNNSAGFLQVADVALSQTDDVVELFLKVIHAHLFSVVACLDTESHIKAENACKMMLHLVLISNGDVRESVHPRSYVTTSFVELPGSIRRHF